MRQTTGVTQRLNNIGLSLSSRSEPCQNGVLPLRISCSSLRKESRTVPLLEHRHRSFTVADLVQSPHGTLFSILIRFANPNGLLQKLGFFDQEEQVLRLLFQCKSELKKRNREGLARLEVVVLQSL